MYHLPTFQEKLVGQLEKQQKKINELLYDIGNLKEDLKIYYIDTYMQLTFMHFSSFIAIRDQFNKLTIFSEATSFFSQIRNGLPYFLDPITAAVKNQDIP